LIVNTEVTDEHVLLSFTLKRRVQSLRRYAWDIAAVAAGAAPEPVRGSAERDDPAVQDR
jgi:hypothetical protein